MLLNIMEHTGNSFTTENAPIDHCFSCQTKHVRSYRSLPTNHEVYLVICLDEKKCGAKYLVDKENKPNIVTKL